jgi:NADH-quinone oxidoreductase subunit A
MGTGIHRREFLSLAVSVATCLGIGSEKYYPSIIYIKLLRKVIQSTSLAILISAGVSVDALPGEDVEYMFGLDPHIVYYLQIIQVVIFVVAGFALPIIGMIGLSFLFQFIFGYGRPNPLKNQPYECGMKPIQEANVQFDIRYYLYALLFIVFDIEIIFLVPWAIASAGKDMRSMGTMVAPTEMTIFIAILAVGLAYAWKKGALKWE